MSRTFLDDDLRQWEVYPSGGRFGLPIRVKVVFHCLSDEAVRPRFVRREDDDEAEAEDLVMELTDDQLRELLRISEALD